MDSLLVKTNNSISLIEEGIFSGTNLSTSLDIADWPILQSDSDLTPYDIAFCFACSFVSVFISTSDEVERWLADIHDKSNGQSVDCNPLQTMISSLLKHKGDDMDQFSTRLGDDPYRLFHRLFWGHDPFSWSNKPNEINDNPFYLLFNQAQENNRPGLLGIIQAVRHLIADSLSKQGLALPLSSYLEYVNDNKRPWNYILDIVQQLSVEAYGNKRYAEQIYEHLFTIRAQDAAGGMLSTVTTKVYLAALHIDNSIRASQLKLLNTSMSFFCQAIFGMAKQNGIPYINYPLGAQMAKDAGALLLASNVESEHLAKETDRLIQESEEELKNNEQLLQFVKSDLKNTWGKESNES